MIDKLIKLKKDNPIFYRILKTLWIIFVSFLTSYLVINVVR